MQKGRNLTREEKSFLKGESLDPKNFLRIKKTPEGYEFLQKSTGRILSIRR